MPEDENQAEETTALEPTKEPIEEQPKTEESAAVEQPVIETTLQPQTPIEEPVPPAEETTAPSIPEPLPEPIIETPKVPALPKVEPKPDPELLPTPMPEPIKPEVVKPEVEKPVELPSTPSSLTSEEVIKDTPVAPAPPPIAPPKHDPKYTKDIPKKVLELTAEEINAARLLWAREHIGEAQAQGNKNRHARMNKIMDEIETFVKANTQTTTHAIANSVNLSERSASGYIQKLVKDGRIKASGNSRNRRYFG